MPTFEGKGDEMLAMRQRRLTIRTDINCQRGFPGHEKRRAFFRQSFISTGAGAFFFGTAGVAVSSDDPSFAETGAAVGSDCSLIGGTLPVVSSDGSLFDGTGAAVGFNGSGFGVTGTDVSSVGRGRGNGVSNRAGNEPRCCRLPSVPLVNQLEISCAISDRGDRASIRVDDGACAFTDAGPSVTRNREYVAAFRNRTCCFRL